MVAALQAPLSEEEIKRGWSADLRIGWLQFYQRPFGALMWLAQAA